MVSFVLGDYTYTGQVDAAAKKELKIEWFNVGAGDSMFIKLPNKKQCLLMQVLRVMVYQ